MVHGKSAFTGEDIAELILPDCRPTFAGSWRKLVWDRPKARRIRSNAWWPLIGGWPAACQFRTTEVALHQHGWSQDKYCW